ncbi:NAD(P)-dependent oxidoreductase [Tistrella sp. BH-R2-4]|uniref:NAD(P)-dependent oxidoreductase n=1 Tax=Tistrella arctica TaxID=3133430 RepID=A0ABU9YGZ5_9PROT
MTAAAPDATTAPRRVIVFGGGQIGTFTLRSLLAAGHEVVVADRAPDAAFLRRYGRHAGPVHSLDICDAPAVAGLMASCGRVDAVILTAGMTGALAAADPAGARRVALDGTGTVLDAAGAAGIPRAVLVSSLAVYGAPAEADRAAGSLIESRAPIDPPTVYGRILADMERMVTSRRHGPESGPDCVLMRIAGVYGPNRFGHGSHSSILLERMLYCAAQGFSLTLEGYAEDRDDLVYVKDVGAALARAATCADRPDGPINVATGRVASMAELIDALGAVFATVDVRLKPPARPRPPLQRLPLDIGRLTGSLGIAPRTIEDSLRDYAREAGFDVAAEAPSAEATA